LGQRTNVTPLTKLGPDQFVQKFVNQDFLLYARL